MHPLLRLVFVGAFNCLISAALVFPSTNSAIGAERSPTGRAPSGGGHWFPRDAVQIPANGAPIVLDAGKGTLIRLARPASTVFIANPEIADVQVKSPQLVYVTAKSPGSTVIYAVDASDNVLLNAPVRVEFALSQLRQSLQRLVPGSAISVDQVDTNLLLSGTVADAGQADKAKVLAAAVTGAVKGGQVVNRLSVATPNQVNLQVRIAEVDRNILKQIGVDWSRLGRTVSFHTVSNQGLTMPTNQLSVGMLSNVLATVDALSTEGFLTVLAEPNLTAISGQTASFLAGGEFPYEVAQSSAGSAPVFTVEFKQFGVQLAFTPTIIDANHLNLRVRPEVSQLDFANAVTVSGSLVPALTVRRAETTIDLASGQSFALAGLLMHNTSQDISRVHY
jgi:pilus assembly protein CpaC